MFVQIRRIGTGSDGHEVLLMKSYNVFQPYLSPFDQCAMCHPCRVNIWSQVLNRAIWNVSQRLLFVAIYCVSLRNCSFSLIAEAFVDDRNLGPLRNSITGDNAEAHY